MSWLLLLTLGSKLIQHALSGPTSEGEREAAQTVQDIFIESPLSQRPFSISLSALPTKHPYSSEHRRALAEHILRVSPRSISARLTLAELNYREGMYRETAYHLSRLIELDRGNANSFLDILVAMSAQTHSRAAIEEILIAHPVWGDRLVSKLAQQSDDFDFLIALSREYPSTQSATIGALIRSGNLDRAHAVFREFLDKESLKSASVPYDNGFYGLTGAQPFNWRVNTSFARLRQSGGLEISFFGQGRPWIADQTLKLSSGAHIASFTMQGTLYPGAGHFAWSIGCIDGNEDLLNLSIKQLESTPVTISRVLNVPQKDCSFQRLRLFGVAGEFPRTARATVTNVEITRANEVAAP
ncbi:MAG TPA: hypothetical protein EYG57_06420 [Planctomycetes bacterium]|nr:hypothetical protein [Planctomycetota bacterium]